MFCWASALMQESSSSILKGARDMRIAVQEIRVGRAPPPRRFEFSAGRSNKFWSLSRNGAAVTLRFGRIGTQGQSQVKSFDDEAAAAQHVECAVKQKLAKGYREIP
jgi:predicted DNA-binding WGR domain protein